MLEQVSTAITFVAFYTASKAGKTGLTVTVDVYNPAGSAVVTAAAASEIGGGLYRYTLSGASATAEGEYIAIFKTSDGTVDLQHIPAMWSLGRAGVEYLDAATSSRLSAAGYTAPPSVVAVRTEMDANSTKLAQLDAAVSSRLAGTAYVQAPSVAAIRAEMDANSTRLDVAVSSRLAGASYAAPPSAASIAAAVWDYLTNAISTAGSIGKAVKDNLDVAVSSRLAASSYAAAPTAAAVRAEMDVNSTKLAQLDVAVSSRLAATSYTAPPTVAAVRAEIDTNSTKLDAPVSSRLAGASYSAPPSAASIATAVWDYLASAATAAGSLGKLVKDFLDVAVSSRLAGASYSAAPSAAAIRAEMDANSAKLAQLDATVSSRLASASYSAAPTAAAIADVVWDEALADHSATGTTGKKLADLTSGGGGGSGLTSEQDTILRRLDVEVSTRATPANVPTVAAIRADLDTNSTKLAQLDATVSSRLAASGYTAPPSVTSIAEAVWDRLTGAITAVGSIGRLLKDNLDAAISTRLASASYTAPPSVAAVRSELDANSTKLAQLDVAVSSRLAGAAFVPAPSAAAVADAVWDEALTSHTTAGSAGKKLGDLTSGGGGGGGDPLLSAVPGAYARGTAGWVLGQITPGNVTVTSPVSRDASQIRLVRGDDYAVADNRAIALTETAGLWPTLTDAAVELVVVARPGGVVMTAPGTVVTASGPSREVQFALTAAQTGALPIGTHTFYVGATIAGREVTLASGSMVVEAGAP